MLLPQHIVCIQYVILLFLFCQQRLLLRTIKETKCTLLTRKNCTLCRFYYGLSTHNENAKTGHSFCYALFFMAESEGLGSLRSPSSLLRKLSYCKPLLTRLRLAKDCKGSNPVFTFKQKTGHSFCYALFFMAESKGFEPSNRFRRLHDFQSCSFDQLGQLSIDQMTRNIIYDFIQKSKQIF